MVFGRVIVHAEVLCNGMSHALTAAAQLALPPKLACEFPLELRLSSLRSALNFDSLISQTYVSEHRGRKVVVKNFSHSMGVLKWAVFGVLYRLGYPYSVYPLSRMKRELRFFLCLNGSAGRILTPTVITFDMDKRIEVREFVDGTPLNPAASDKHARLLGEALGELHKSGWCLGDTKPSNFIYRDEEDRIFVIDGEQAERLSHEARFRSWDVILLLLFTSIYKPTLTQQEYRSRLEAFVDGYAAVAGTELSEETTKFVPSIYNVGLLALMPWHHLIVLRELFT